MKRLFIVMVLAILMVSCTENQQARTFGGNATVELPENTKLITATWKNNQLWYLIRERRADEPIEEYTFQEQSSFGMMEGTVTFKEK